MYPHPPVSLARGDRLHVLSMGSDGDSREQCLFSRSSFDVGQTLFIPILQVNTDKIFSDPRAQR